MKNLNKSDSFEKLFYYTNEKSSFKSLKTHIDDISIIAPLAYNVDADGIVWGRVDTRVINLANDNKTTVMPIIHNPGFEQEMLTILLDNKIARMRVIESLLDECKKYNYFGIQFDFENLHINSRDNFTNFCIETSEAFHTAGFKFSIAVVPCYEKFPGPTKYFKWLYKNWRGGYDYKALGEIADFISVMTYAQHTKRTPPGPIAGIPWVVKNIQFIINEIPPEKLSLGIPVISQHWSTVQDDEKYLANARSWSKELKYSNAISIVEQYDAEIKWHEDQKVSFTFFENDGLFEYIFFEERRSFQHKLDLVKKFRLIGFSAWAIGYEDPKIWELLKYV